MGQYVFINIPAISTLEWHPFTISSSPLDKTTTHHIKSMSGSSSSGSSISSVSQQWTGKLLNISKSWTGGDEHASRLVVNIDGNHHHHHHQSSPSPLSLTRPLSHSHSLTHYSHIRSIRSFTGCRSLQVYQFHRWWHWHHTCDILLFLHRRQLRGGRSQLLLALAAGQFSVDYSIRGASVDILAQGEYYTAFVNIMYNVNCDDDCIVSI